MDKIEQTQPFASTPNADLDLFIQTNLLRWQHELAEFCAIPSVSGWQDTASLQRMAEITKSTLTERKLKTESWQTDGLEQPVIFGQLNDNPDAPTLLFYNHYDVQPVGPLEKWHSDPFELTERDGRWWARGVASNKGNLVARLAAIETYRAIYGELLINLKFIVEGEHESGSPHLAQLVADKKTELAADVCVWEDGQYSDDGTPILNLGLKGILSVELTSRTLKQDVHSSLAGILPGAAWKLIWALAAINDDRDGIQIRGFYDDIAVPTREDSQFLAATKQQYQTRSKQRLSHFEVDEYTAGVEGLPLLIAEFFTPTANVSGIQGGYVGPGSMLILPAFASARLDFRLVPNQEPLVILELLKDYLGDYRFGDIEIQLKGAAMKPARTSPSDPFVQLAVRTANEVAGVAPLLIPLAPISGPLYLFKEALNDLPAIGAGVSYDGSNQHAPNENIRSEDFVRHIKFLVQLMRNLVDFNTDQQIPLAIEPELPPEPFNFDFGVDIFENSTSNAPIVTNGATISEITDAVNGKHGKAKPKPASPRTRRKRSKHS